jgi:interferon-induced transmembrane protein
VSRPQQPTHMGWAIGCVFLFWPLAIPAIVNASRAHARLAAGDRGGAERAARSARTWATWATVVGIIWWVLACCPLGILAAADPTDVSSAVAHLLGRS